MTSHFAVDKALYVKGVGVRLARLPPILEAPVPCAQGLHGVPC